VRNTNLNSNLYSSDGIRNEEKKAAPLSKNKEHAPAHFCPINYSSVPIWFVLSSIGMYSINLLPVVRGLVRESTSRVGTCVVLFTEPAIIEEKEENLLSNGEHMEGLCNAKDRGSFIRIC